MCDLILQGSILIVGISYLVALAVIPGMRNKATHEKLSYAAFLTLIAILIEIALIAALFNQGRFG